MAHKNGQSVTFGQKRWNITQDSAARRLMFGGILNDNITSTEQDM